MQKILIVLTVEHASSFVPPCYRFLFKKNPEILLTHRAYDSGAINSAFILSRQLNAPLFYGKVSRLLIDLNRSARHRNLYSEFIDKNANSTLKEELMRKYWQPFRSIVLKYMEEKIAGGYCILHISVHSFTSSLSVDRKFCDLGILYDPNRQDEKEFAKLLRDSLRGWRLRRNYPYRGKADGHTSALRKEFPATSYAGIELEFNQSLQEKNRKLLVSQIANILQQFKFD